MDHEKLDEKPYAVVEHEQIETRSNDAVDSFSIGVPKPLRKLQEFERWFDGTLGIETQGVNRIREEDRQPPSMWNMFLIWASFNVHVGSATIGVLGAELGLSLRLNVAAAIIGIMLGAIGSAMNATLGPKTGLRQVAQARFSFGMWGTRLISCLNIIVIGGFFVTALIVMGQLLNTVSNYTISVTLGIVIVSVLSYTIAVFGYRVIHTFEKYSWIATAILFFVLIGQAAPHVDATQPSFGTNNLAIAGSFMTIMSVNMSNGIGWSTIMSDYLVNYSHTVPKWKIFTLVYSGLVIFITLPVITGAVIGNVAFANPDSHFYEVYEAHGVGGIIGAIYHPLGWSKFALVILSFSAIGDGVAVCYSAGLSMQLMGEYFRAVPRFIWSFIFMVVVAVIAIAGKAYLSAVVQSFVSIVGYWVVSFVIILFLEDRLFRRNTGYELDAWNTQSKLPWGIAATSTLLIAYAAGGVPGMAQVWYVGPIAAKFGPYGGDVGIWTTGAVTVVVYLALRPLEKHFIGR